MRKTQSDLAAPGCCTICRQTRVHGDEFMVETGALNDFGVQTPLTGQIMICNVCIDELAAEAGGYVKEADVERERADYSATRNELAVIKQDFEGVGDHVDEALQRVRQLDERLAKREAEGST